MEKGIKSKKSRYSIEDIKEVDILDVIELEKECFSKNYYSASSIADMYANNMYKFIGSYYKGKLIGYLILLDSIDVYEIVKIAIAHRYRGRAIGAKLIEEGISRIKVNLMLEVRESNGSAIKLYEKVGFEKIGRRKGYYQDTKEDALILELKNQQQH